ncbi:hypothetical protein [Clavibacter michiganensis]|uniref:hypothetical protein n=1 Tax=Clavibacter michiganensis TaxID=28447 RepID=UPI001866FEF2|nr:hypothetical protein [Clavibacter michiganensis]MBE3077031.1 hypothetical protein [Clavibacter michiganensis subsp. michiganensis]MDO4045901.1 hypothetical protein [Clavibacter michiganensis]MDO4054767.1 hypothetical protein [Clavibacter michiganensis]MDO4058117.1 hypothetical protein [Clavibacter michiganensis]UOW05323.1 hypothetical protein MU580_15870 [Clavibacter michiganensis subsp. michiganensis]
MDTIDPSPELAEALTFGVAGNDAIAHAARAEAARAALARHSDQMDRAYASARGQADPWKAPPFGAELVVDAGGDLDAVLASPAFVPEVQRELGIAAHDTFVNDEAGARYVQFNPTAGHIDDAYEGARAIAAQLIERGDVSHAAVVGAGRDYGEILMLTAEQRTTLLEGIREIGDASGDPDGRFASVAEHVEWYGELPERADLREALVTVLEGQFWTVGAPDLPEHLRDVVADLTPDASRPDFTHTHSMEGSEWAGTPLSESQPTPPGYSPRELSEREMLRAAGIDPNERAAQPMPSSETPMPQPEVQRSRGDDSVAH